MQKNSDELKYLRQFGITLAVIFGILGAAHFMKHRVVLSQWFLCIGIIMLCAGIFIPKTLKPLHFIFLKAAHAIGWFNTRVILMLIYFMLISPIAIIMRVFGKNTFNRRLQKDTLTYWIKRRNLKPTREQLEKQF